MARNRISRQREFELMVTKDRMRREQELDREDAMLGYERGRYNPQDYNILGPNEEVLERRRVHKRNRVAMATPRRNSTGNILMENFFFLLLLVGSICALYYALIHILN